MNNRRRMIKRALWMMALSAPTWEEAMKYCHESKYPEKIINGILMILLTGQKKSFKL